MTRWAGPVIDAHHHFWQPSLGRNPWLRPDAMISFRYGDYSAIKRDYLPPDLLAEADGVVNLVGTVTMETEWEPDDPVGEMEHLSGIAETYRLPNAAVAHAALDDPDLDAVLTQLASLPLVRGIRDKPGQAPDPSTAADHATKLDDPAWQRGYAQLADHGLHFELQTAWWHLDQAAALAARHPDITMIINHTGLPVDRSAEGIAGWRAALSRIAALPHVSIKISGIGQPGQRWSVAANGEIVLTTAEIFGPDRIMFASNFPVDGLTGSYAEIMGGYLTITAPWSSSEQYRALCGNAIRHYRIDPAELHDQQGQDDQQPQDER